MSTSPNHRDEPPVPPKQQSTVILMVATIGDTTWRMFVPTISLTVVGLLLDKTWQTTPWFLITGIVTGSLLAFWLVRSQMKKVL